MLKKNNKIIYFLASLFFVTLIYYIFFVGTAYYSWITYCFYIVALTLPVIFGVYTLEKLSHKSLYGKIIFWLTFTMILWFAGDFLWFIYDMFLNKQPFSGLPDWIILVGYAGLFMSVIVQLRNIRLNLEFKKVYPYYLLTGILIIFSIYYFITLLYQSNNGINFNLINVLHIIANASLFFVMFLVAMLVKHFKGGKVSHFWLIIMLAVLANLLGYSFYNIFESQYNLGGNYIFAMIDLLWILSNLLFTYGLYYFSGFLNQLKLSFKNEIK